MVQGTRTLNIDWDMLEKAKEGSQSAWKYLLHKYQPGLLRLAAMVTGSPDSAADVLQETFIRLYKSPVKHQQGSFKAYITTIAYRLALQAKRKTARFFSLGEKDFPDESPTPVQSVIQSDRDRAMMRIIDSLEPDHKEVLLLRFYGDYTYEEIANITGVPLGTVKSRIFYAVKKCREQMRSLDL